MMLRNRFINRTAVVVVTLVLVILLAGGIISYYARKKAEEGLKDIGGSIGSLNVNLFTRSLSIENFKLNFSGDTAHAVPHVANINNITVSGISLYDLLFHKKLRISEIFLEDGSIRFNEAIQLKKKTTGAKVGLNGVTIDYFTIKNLKAQVVHDSLLKFSGVLNLTVNSIESSDTSVASIKSYGVKNVEGSIRRLVINHEGGFYQTSVGNIYVNSSEQKLQIDSVLLKPNFPKYRFARKVGKQTDRFNAFIRKIEIGGLNFDALDDSSFVASKIEISSAELLAFRDKRIPFKETQNKPLPVEALKNLAFEVEVDTIKINDTKITYEEFPPDGFQSGKLTFENLKATMTNVSNRAYYNKSKFIKLEASAKLMGRGLIEANFLLPLDGDKLYNATGKISNMALHHLNPMLENVAFISIESGKLNALNFNFDYTDKTSNGSLIINYENLKMKGLKKDKEASKNDLKTFVINLVIKNDKDKSVPTAKRTGEIAFERDKKRQIFNFWWKSLLSGIKATVVSPSDTKK